MIRKKNGRVHPKVPREHPHLPTIKGNAGNTDGKVGGCDGPQGPDVLLGNRKRKEGWRFATWNVGSTTGRGRKVADEMEKRNIDVMCIQETKWGGNAAREIGGDINCTTAENPVKEMELGLHYSKSGKIMYWK